SFGTFFSIVFVTNFEHPTLQGMPPLSIGFQPKAVFFTLLSFVMSYDVFFLQTCLQGKKRCRSFRIAQQGRGKKRKQSCFSCFC
ncbi:MAG: hypothetical protein Q4F34_06210, partial [Prevotellaceae bacterium]|nr:hypothetical protein [Prevotellaceae bacterium]